MREMKDSGIEWIGKIPAEWKTNTVFQLFTQVKKKNTNLQEQNLLSLSYGKIKRKDIETTDGLLPESFDGYNVIEADDIVLRLTDLQNDHKSLRVGLATERGIVTSAYLTIRNRSESLAKYLYYYLHSFDISKGFYGMGAGVRQGLNWDGMKWLKILTPSVAEQQRIVSFLDTECDRIDAVIEQTRSSIEEYKKLKQAIITQAVTKGIRLNRPMKDSGSKWIGEIAEDYQCRKLKTFSDVISKGTTPKDIINEINSDYCVRYIKSENIVENELVVLPEFGIQLKVHEGELKRSQLSERDILFVIAGASIGKTAIMKKEMIPANTNQATSFIRIKEKYMPFQRLLWYILQSDITKKYISLFAVQSAQPNLSMADLGDMRIPFPVDLKEINQILSYIDETIVELDRLITLKEQLITELNSYKKNTIFEYVTGKKEVPA